MADDLARLLDPDQATTDADFEATWKQLLHEPPGRQPRRTSIPRGMLILGNHYPTLVSR